MDSLCGEASFLATGNSESAFTRALIGAMFSRPRRRNQWSLVLAAGFRQGSARAVLLLDRNIRRTYLKRACGDVEVNRKNFDRLASSLKQTKKFGRGEMKAGLGYGLDPLDIKTIRKRLNQSQSEFALMIGVPLSTLQNWEQGRRRPEGPAQALLRVAAYNPRAVARALAS